MIRTRLSVGKINKVGAPVAGRGKLLLTNVYAVINSNTTEEEACKIGIARPTLV